MQNTGSDYSPPSRYEVGGSLLKATYDSYYEEEVAKLLDDVELYGISVYGDGATIKITPLINILACFPRNPACVLDVIDCSNHMSEGSKKDSKLHSQGDTQSDFKDRKSGQTMDHNRHVRWCF